MTVADVSLERERAIVDYDPSVLTVARMMEAIQGSVILPRLRRAIEHAVRALHGEQAGRSRRGRSHRKD